MQSQRAYTTARYSASPAPVSDGWDIPNNPAFTMFEMLENAKDWLTDRQVWEEAKGDHEGDLYDDMLQEAAERAEFFRFGSSGGF